MNIKAVIFLTIAAIFCAGISFADTDNTNLEATPPKNPDDWVFKAHAGIMGFYMPKYEGSDLYQPLYMPEIDLSYGPLFASISQGAGIFIPLNESRSFIVAPAIRWRVKRNLANEARDAIEYIGDVRPTVTLNTIYRTGPLMFNFRMTEGLSDSNTGASFNLGATFRDDVTDRINLTVYTTAIYGDRRYNQTYFGITPVESIEFGFPEHASRAGLKSLDIGGLFRYFITDHKNISADFMFEYMRLVGPAAKSPITLNKDQFLFGVGASYYF
ncbi:MAG: MipA/OmpV family protein [Alphaproteobacteria bacterium]|nr:MipA/OmpV family protein [Alphaproteobacteria bacterium]MCL2890001.1 MipA/OmpV family protein [Alphaproteobacteria bacterium]